MVIPAHLVEERDIQFSSGEVKFNNRKRINKNKRFEECFDEFDGLFEDHKPIVEEPRRVFLSSKHINERRLSEFFSQHR